MSQKPKPSERDRDVGAEAVVYLHRVHVARPHPHRVVDLARNQRMPRMVEIQQARLQRSGLVVHVGPPDRADGDRPLR